MLLYRGISEVDGKCLEVGNTISTCRPCRVNDLCVRKITTESKHTIYNPTRLERNSISSTV
jgi:hypothetical protein